MMGIDDVELVVRRGRARQHGRSASAPAPLDIVDTILFLRMDVLLPLAVIKSYCAHSYVAERCGSDLHRNDAWRDPDAVRPRCPGRRPTLISPPLTSGSPSTRSRYQVR